MLNTLAKNTSKNVPWVFQKKLLEERLRKGKESAAELQSLLQKPLDRGSVSAAVLAIQILTYLTDSLSILGPNLTLANNSTMNMPLSNQKEILEERLQKGKESATQLQTLLQRPLDNHGSASAAELVVQALRSFTDSLSVLGPNEICQIVGADGETSPAGQREKPGVKDRRGCYKRRKVSDSWTTMSANIDDEYVWRKYGQKQVQNSKFPRCYFRCSYRYDQGCKASKQVQRITQDPLLYQTKYFCHHTCKKDPTNSCLPLLERKITSKQKVSEIMKVDTHSDLSDNKSLLDSSLWQDFMASGSSGPANVMPSESESVDPCSSDAFHFMVLDMEAFS